MGKGDMKRKKEQGIRIKVESRKERGICKGRTKQKGKTNTNSPLIYKMLQEH